MVLGLLLLTVVSSASGSYVTQTTSVSVPQTTTDFTTFVAASTFDSSLGTLASISISFTDSANMHGFVQNTSASAQKFTVTEDSKVSLSYGASTLLTNDLTIQQSYTNLGPTQSAQFAVSNPVGSAGPMTISSGPLFDAFLQPSSNVMLTFSTLTSTTVVGGGGNISTGIYSTAAATFTIDYLYTPFASVPEPSSLAMTLIGGMALLTTGYWSRRNRRRSADTN